MSVVDKINESWGWNGIDAVAVVEENAFGNLLIKDRLGRYWRMCPEELSCTVVAQQRAELDKLSRNAEFIQDWNMENMVRLARSKLGPLENGRKYSLKVPGCLGGEYVSANLATIALAELIRASGHVTKQILDLPDGAQVRLVLKD
jgi:hypothetical protein